MNLRNHITDWRTYEACPSCKADPGLPCRMYNGRKKTVPHPSRLVNGKQLHRLTRHDAWKIALLRGDAHMHEHGRDIWNLDDYQAAATHFRQLWFDE